MKDKLYNVFFPIWFLLIFPITWLLAIPINFAIDSIVLLICIKVLNLNGKNVYKKSIILVVIFGFISDIIGSILLVLTQFFPSVSIFDDIQKAVSWNPFSNIFGFIYVLISLIISAFCIYYFNKKISFKKLDISDKLKKKMALILAICTAPYLFFYPSSLMYSNNYASNIYNYDKEYNENFEEFTVGYTSMNKLEL